MKNFLRSLLATLLAVFSGQLMASPPTVAGGEGDPECFPPSTCVPIDNGLVWLLLIGLAFGAWLIYSQVKAKA